MNNGENIGPNASVDGYIRKNKQWGKELLKLREIVLACGLNEEIKWRVPCYTFQERNVVLLGAFKGCCTLSFVKGVLLKDKMGVLESPGPNSQSVRMLRFASIDKIAPLETVLKAYIREAIALEKTGAKVAFKKINQHAVPEELRSLMGQTPSLKAAFEALTPGRQRAYLLHFSAPRQSQTRRSRIKKCIPRILQGKGMND